MCQQAAHGQHQQQQQQVVRRLLLRVQVLLLASVLRLAKCCSAQTSTSLTPSEHCPLLGTFSVMLRVDKMQQSGFVLCWWMMSWGVDKRMRQRQLLLLLLLLLLHDVQAYVAWVTGCWLKSAGI
jgi:hypothetical protein